MEQSWSDLYRSHFLRIPLDLFFVINANFSNNMLIDIIRMTAEAKVLYIWNTKAPQVNINRIRKCEFRVRPLLMIFNNDTIRASNLTFIINS